MGNYRVIADTIATVRSLLGAEVTGSGVAATVETDSWDGDGLHLRLLHVQTFEHRPAGDELQREGETDDGTPVLEFLPPPIPLTLHFLLTAGGDQGRQATLLGLALQAIQDHPSLAPDQLEGEHLRRSGDRIRLALDEQLDRAGLCDLFRGLGLPARPALAFQVRVELHSDKVLRAEPAVRSRVGQFGRHDPRSRRKRPGPPPSPMIREER